MQERGFWGPLQEGCSYLHEVPEEQPQPCDLQGKLTVGGAANKGVCRPLKEKADGGQVKALSKSEKRL